MCDSLYQYARDFQTLIAGCLAICAALIAFTGQSRQARATLEAAASNRQAAQRAAAAGFVAELSDCRLVLIGTQRRLATWNPMYSEPPLVRIDTGIFDANQSAVGLLPPDEAFVVALAYKMVRNLDRQHQRILEHKVDRPATGGELIGPVQRAQVQVEKAIRGIVETAGLDANKAKAILEVGGLKHED